MWKNKSHVPNHQPVKDVHLPNVGVLRSDPQQPDGPASRCAAHSPHPCHSWKVLGQPVGKSWKPWPWPNCTKRKHHNIRITSDHKGFIMGFGDMAGLHLPGHAEAWGIRMGHAVET